MVKLHLLRLNLLNNLIIKGVGALKISRPLSILLCLIVLISSFTVTVYGADDENLIEPNLKNWTILEDYKSSTTVLSGSDTGAVQLVSISPAGEQNGFSANVGALYDITSSYKVGDKYTLSFDFLNADKYIGGGVGIISSKAFLDYNGVLYIGLATSDNTGVTAVDGYFVEINGDNYNQYVDSTITYSFEMPSGVVNPCIFINFIAFLPDADMVNNCWLAFRDIKFINQTEADEQGFLDGLFEWFEVKFKNIGDSFSDLGAKLGELKSSFTESISNLGESIKGFFDDLGTKFNTAINSLGESIGGFFTKLGNLILYASWSEEPPENPFLLKESPMSSLAERLDNISSAFDSAGESFENVIDSITGPVYLLDEFTKEFGWILGILVFTLLVIVISRFIGL